MVSQILSATFTSQGKDTGVLCSGQKVIVEDVDPSSYLSRKHVLRMFLFNNNIV